MDWGCAGCGDGKAAHLPPNRAERLRRAEALKKTKQPGAGATLATNKKALADQQRLDKFNKKREQNGIVELDKADPPGMGPRLRIQDLNHKLLRKVANDPIPETQSLHIESEKGDEESTIVVESESAEISKVGFPTEAEVKAREDKEAGIFQHDRSSQTQEQTHDESSVTATAQTDDGHTEGDMEEGSSSSTFFEDLGHHIDVFLDAARKHLEEYWMWYLIAMIIILIICLLLWYRKRLMVMCKLRRTRQEMIEDILEI